MSPTIPTPSVGRIVLVPVQTKRSLGDGNPPVNGPVEIRPGIIVRVFDRTDGQMPLINVRVFTDGSNDGVGMFTGAEWATSLHYDQDNHTVGTWHWMPYQIQTAGTRHQDVPKAEPVGTCTLTFGAAILALKAGQKVARAGWNGKGMWLVLMPALYLPPFNTQGTERKVNDRTAKWIGEDKPLDCQPYIAMWTAQQKWQPGWLASQADMLAEDWMIVE